MPEMISSFIQRMVQRLPAHDKVPQTRLKKLSHDDKLVQVLLLAVCRSAVPCPVVPCLVVRDDGDEVLLVLLLLLLLLLYCCLAVPCPDVPL